MAEQNPGDEMIQVKKSELEKLIETTTRLSRDNETLFKAVDKNALARVRQLDGTASLVKTAKAWFWPNNKKFVMATKLVKNIGEIVAGRYYEDQILRVVYEDGQTEDMPYLNFHRYRTFVPGEILSRRLVGEEGILKLQFADGKTLEVSEKFIN